MLKQISTSHLLSIARVVGCWSRYLRAKSGFIHNYIHTYGQFGVAHQPNVYVFGLWEEEVPGENPHGHRTHTEPKSPHPKQVGIEPMTYLV